MEILKKSKPHSTLYEAKLYECEFVESSVRFFEHLLFYDKIRIEDVPRVIRIHEDLIYTIAFRMSRAKSNKRYAEAIKVLKSDLDFIHGHDKVGFQRRYDNELWSLELAIRNEQNA